MTVYQPRTRRFKPSMLPTRGAEIHVAVESLFAGYILSHMLLVHFIFMPLPPLGDEGTLFSGCRVCVIVFVRNLVSMKSLESMNGFLSWWKGKHLQDNEMIRFWVSQVKG